MIDMSTASDHVGGGAIPPLTLGLRLFIAMQHGDVSREQMAKHIGVHPTTITRWTGNHFDRPPAVVILRAWAQLCGVSEAWLVDGSGEMPTPPAYPHLVTMRDATPPKRGRKSPTRRNLVYSSVPRNSKVAA